MPRFMDIDRGVDEPVATHEKAGPAQQKHGVTDQRYWTDEDRGAVFCLFDGPG